MTTETKTNETTKLEELLAKARATREARRQQQEAEKAAEQAEWQQPFGEAVARARAIVEPALGECATEEYDGSYRRLLVIPRVWKGLVTFYMETGNGGMWKLAGAKATCYLAGPDEWELSGPLAWLAAMDDLFQERRKTALEWYTASMDATRDETVARETHAQLLALDETRAEEWDALLAAAHDRIAARAAAMDAYVQALGEWRYKYERILNENRATVAGAGRALDKTFERYEVAFAAVGDDEEEPYRETVWAVEPDPEEGGYWSIFENGNIVRRRLLRPLWVGEEIVQTLSEAGAGPWRRAYYVHEAGMTVYYLPWHKVELHRQLDKTIEPLPAEPTPPAFLGDGLTAAERERIAEVTRGMARVEIPF
jgi:hypothetical protein